ncbi:unnamed protein product [Dibothriocephalus latus]|uniref:Reverse transcriptase domain-containing protein n=1 Tax=Dibothriocephalus latus TaxID=60516 RepID=A0A3P7MYV1_DIBLA|nr:unnamed protein product [Dibothriocephalus latus]
MDWQTGCFDGSTLTADSDTTVRSPTHFLKELKRDLTVEAIQLLQRDKYDEMENRLGHTRVLQLPKFCLTTCLTFNRIIDKQIKGTPWGSPISGLIAEVVLQRLKLLVFRNQNPVFSMWVTPSS